MPSKSKAQQRFFGMVDAYKKGEMKNASSKIKKAAEGMSMSDVKDFAETKHKGLPEKVEENIIRLTESDLHKIVKESVNGILDEGWSSYVDYYYPDNEKEPKENNYFNPEKAKREPSKSSRVRRREYMRKKQENVEESTIMRLTESDLHKIVKECVNSILNENRRDGNIEFVTSKDGYTNYVIDHDKKEVSPMHGYYPNGGKNRAKKTWLQISRTR